MSPQTFASALCMALTALAPAALGADVAPAGATTSGPAAATSGMVMMRPSAASAPRILAKSSWTFPAPLAGKPPAETWLAPLLSDEDRKHRAAEDNALMVGLRADHDSIQNAGILQDELQAGDYDDLDAQLDALLAKFQADPAYEFALESAVNFAEQGHAHGYLPDTALIQAWVKARPNSPWAHYSAGMRWCDTAWADRGEGSGGDVTDEQWKKVHEDEAQARAELQTALKLNPKQPLAWSTLMIVDRTDPGPGLEQVTADFNQGSKQVPSSFLLAAQYEVALEPRWMGSAGMMDDFAQSQLANVDRNPRFWDLQGESLADSGCAACNDYHWDVSLKQYNAALAFGDRPSWLAKAGDAAMHVHRYALAYAFYERALAYKDGVDVLYWKMFRDFTAVRCDPSKTEEQVERFRKDVVTYGGLDDVEFPHGPDDCVVYQRELPWGTEPVPDGASMPVYAIDSIGHPIYKTEPKTLIMPLQSRSYASPDGAWVLTLTTEDDKTNHLGLRGQASGSTTEVYTSTGTLQVGFTSDSKHLFVSDMTEGKEGGCRYVDPKDPSRDANIKAKVIQWIADQHLSIDLGTLKVFCSQFANDDILTAALAGQMNGQKAFRMFNYDTASGRLVSTFH